MSIKNIIINDIQNIGQVIFDFILTIKSQIWVRWPEKRFIDPGDLTIVKGIREKLQCKSFDWFMHEIAYDITKHFPFKDPENLATGRGL